MDTRKKILLPFFLLLGLFGTTLGGCPGGDDDGVFGDVSDFFQDLGDDLFGDD
ncbi:MAG: hypothetical protein AB7N71_00405 [Phycisphaerae bacterium]